jgi:hypothetical protein
VGGPFPAKREAEAALAVSLLLLHTGGRVDGGAGLTVAEYLDDWLEGKADLHRSTRRSYEDHIRLYLKPGLGHLRLADLRGHHLEQLYAAMRRVGRDTAGRRPSPVLVRLLEARRDDPARRRPLSPARIRRVHLTALSAFDGAAERREIP